MQNRDTIDKVNTILFLLKNQMARPFEVFLRSKISPTGLFLITLLSKYTYLTVECKRLTMSEISNIMQISKQQATQIVMKLENDGFIKRVRDEEDRRKLFVYLTGKGEKLIEEYEDVFRRSLNEKWSSFKEFELKKLDNALDTLLEYLR